MSDQVLSMEDIANLAGDLRQSRVVIEMDIPTTTNTRFRALVNDNWVPFRPQDIAAVEAVFEEPLCLINCVIPYALPFSLALHRLPSHVWKVAVQRDETTLGRDEWSRQHLQQRTLAKCLDHWERKGVHL